VLERALLLAGGAPLTIEHFPGLREVAAVSPPAEETWNLRERMQVCIAQALERFGGNKRKAAEALGITPRTLYRWLKKPDTTA
jgi:DNA-binding NtrC family response regulator